MDNKKDESSFFEKSNNKDIFLFDDLELSMETENDSSKCEKEDPFEAACCDYFKHKTLYDFNPGPPPKPNKNERYFAILDDEYAPDA